jgi:hypothetical protein
MKAANLALRFTLELAALVTLAYWGASATDGVVARVLLGVGLPLAVAVFWGMFVAPRARVVLPTAVRMGLGLAVFACAAAALVDRDHIALGIGFAGASVLNVVLMLLWRQDRIIPRDAA